MAMHGTEAERGEDLETRKDRTKVSAPQRRWLGQIRDAPLLFYLPLDPLISAQCPFRVRPSPPPPGPPRTTRPPH